jgi:putative spermidine/putrescine transport system permease protein
VRFVSGGHSGEYLDARRESFVKVRSTIVYNGHREGYLLVAPAILFIAVLFILPIINVLILSVTEPTVSLANYQRIFTVPVYIRVLGNTFKNAIIVTIICLVLAYPLAYSLVRRGPWVTALLLAAVAIPFWTGFLVRTFSWMVIFGSEGPVANLMRFAGVSRPPQMLFTTFSALWGMTHILLPYMTLALYGVMRKIDLQHLKAAESLGARPLQAFWLVFVPQSFAGVINGSVLVFAMCLGFYVTPVLLGSPSDVMLAQLIGQQVEELLAWGFASALAMVLMTTTFALLGIYNYFFGISRLWA